MQKMGMDSVLPKLCFLIQFKSDSVLPETQRRFDWVSVYVMDVMGIWLIKTTILILQNMPVDGDRTLSVNTSINNCFLISIRTMKYNLIYCHL